MPSQLDLRHRVVVTTAVVVAIVAAVVVAMLATGGGRAATAATPTSSDSVTVSGVGTVQGVPDTMTATFDVHVTRGSVQSALDADAATVRRVLGSLQRHGIRGANVQTSSLGLDQHYDNRGRPSGYDATETVTAKITPLRSAGSAVSAAATASGNDVSVDGLSFDIADDTRLLADARTKAFGDAKERARQYAELAGRPLGSVVKVSEVVQVEQVYPQRYEAAYPMPAGASGKALPIRAGEQPVTVDVTVTWRLG